MRENRIFSEAFKGQVVREVTAGMLSKAEAKLKYNLKGHGAVLYWISTFEERENISKKRKMDYSEKSKETLIKRIKELERQLEYEYLSQEINKNKYLTVSQVDRAIEKYKMLRPHLSCNMLTPEEAH